LKISWNCPLTATHVIGNTSEISKVYCMFYNFKATILKKPREFYRIYIAPCTVLYVVLISGIPEEYNKSYTEQKGMAARYVVVSEQIKKLPEDFSMLLTQFFQ
jgi:hypothetical protein